MSTQSDVYVSLEFTENPNTLRYSVNRQLLEKGAVNFVKKEYAELRSPLAAKLMNVPGISEVMIGKDFVTVTKTEEGDWDVVHKSSSQIIEKHLVHGEAVMNVLDEQSELNKQPELNGHKGGNTEIEKRIREILDDEVRPGAMGDKGDITFEKFEDGIVYLYLQGECGTCQSSTLHIKMGIETRLKEAIPEVREVVAI